MRRIGLVLATVLTLAATLSIFGAADANAATGKVITTNGDVLHVWNAPTYPHTVVGTLAQGTVVSFGCSAQGNSVSGPYGTTTVWDRLDSPFPGQWVTDAWINTGSNAPVVPLCGPAGSSGKQYPFAWTGGIGVYPRSGTSMNSAKIGSALAEGTPVAPTCETYGDSVTDTAGSVSTIWDRLPSGAYVSNAYINTGVNGRTPGVPDCLTVASPTPSITPCVFRFRWPNLTLRVGYAGPHRYYGNAYQAVQDWNNAGVGAHLSIAESYQGANILIYDVYDSSKARGGIVGATQVTQYYNPADKAYGGGAYKGIPTLSINTAPIDMLINQYPIGHYKFDDAHITNTFTHELGHAMGLAHSDECTSGPSIMKAGSKSYPTTPVTRISSYDAAELRDLDGMA